MCSLPTQLKSRKCDHSDNVGKTKSNKSLIILSEQQIQNKFRKMKISIVALSIISFVMMCVIKGKAENPIYSKSKLIQSSLAELANTNLITN